MRMFNKLQTLKVRANPQNSRIVIISLTFPRSLVQFRSSWGVTHPQICSGFELEPEDTAGPSLRFCWQERSGTAWRLNVMFDLICGGLCCCRRFMTFKLRAKRFYSSLFICTANEHLNPRIIDCAPLTLHSWHLFSSKWIFPVIFCCQLWLNQSNLIGLLPIRGAAERERRLFRCFYSSCTLSQIRLVCLNSTNACIHSSGLTSAMKYCITVNELRAETIKEAS